MTADDDVAQKTEESWRKTLTPEQFHVLREHGTERPGTSPLNAEKRAGTFRCAGCGRELFSSQAKFESGTGWPSFHTPVEGGIATTVDRTFGMTRTEVHCARCHGHLGHVFPDGPKPSSEAIRTSLLHEWRGSTIRAGKVIKCDPNPCRKCMNRRKTVVVYRLTAANHVDSAPPFG
jgi:peptide-methionine (R)-S-oxide reductase